MADATTTQRVVLGPGGAPRRTGRFARRENRLGWL